MFIFVIAAVLCFLSLMAFEAANTRIENKQLDGNSVYVNMNTYTDLRTLDKSLYEHIDFFETQYKQGSFSYNEIASLSGISADYAPGAIEADETAESIGLVYGEMPKEGEVLITRNLAETLKTQFRLSELDTDRAMLLVVFEGEYRVSGIIDGDTPAVYMGKQDYVNFLGVYNTVQFSDYNNLFFAPDFAETTYTSEILLSDSSTLGDNEVTVEINRNSLYKMMTDTTQADYLVNVANSRLASTSGTSTAIPYLRQCGNVVRHLRRLAAGHRRAGRDDLFGGRSLAVLFRDKDGRRRAARLSFKHTLPARYPQHRHRRVVRAGERGDYERGDKQSFYLLRRARAAAHRVVLYREVGEH